MMFIIIVGLLLWFIFLKNNSDVNKLLKNVEDDEFYLEDYSIFGQHFNVEGCIDKKIDDDISLVLKNRNEEIKIESTFYEDQNKTCFYTSQKINEGIYLDDLKQGNYLLLIKEGTNNYKYYTIKNKTNYKDLEYYTVTRNNKNNKIDILFKLKNKKDYIEFNIKNSKLPNNVYDIVIDPGHGGNDVGSSGVLNGTTYYESKLTLDISLLLKEKLENIGLKVKLTRDDDTYLDPYGEGGRALLPNDYKSKYSLSIHLNSSIGNMTYGGVEVYVPNDINYDFANLLSKNIADIVGYSKKATDKVSKGVYYTYFTKQDIEDSNQEMLEKNMKPFDIKENSPYMYMIREVGGANTGAYIDGRNAYYGVNNYYNSNNTAEPYLLELAYINYYDDLRKVVNNKEEFAKAICNSIKDYLNIS